jgi:hypothetical protein
MPDFIYSAPCGCRVVYRAASDYAQSFMQSCREHATRQLNGIWREAIAYQGDQAFEDWQLAGRPLPDEQVTAA